MKLLGHYLTRFDYETAYLNLSKECNIFCEEIEKFGVKMGDGFDDTAKNVVSALSEMFGCTKSLRERVSALEDVASRFCMEKEEWQAENARLQGEIARVNRYIVEKIAIMDEVKKKNKYLESLLKEKESKPQIAVEDDMFVSKYDSLVDENNELRKCVAELQKKADQLDAFKEKERNRKRAWRAKKNAQQ